MLTKDDLIQIRDLIREEVPPLVRTELQPIGNQINVLQSDVNYLKSAVRQHTIEFVRVNKRLDENTKAIAQNSIDIKKNSEDIQRLETLFEDLDDRFRASTELY